MIPEISALDRAAERVLRSVPAGLARGEIATGLYGVGFLGRWALPRLKAQGVRLQSCYDRSEALHGRFIDGVPVHHVSEVDTHRPEFMVITARHAVKPVSALLAGHGIPHVSYDAWYVAENLAAFRDVHDRVLADLRSREVLRAVLMAMLTGEPAYCQVVCEPHQYFCLPDFCGPKSEIYVDAGAFDGDSIQAFLTAHDGVVAKIHAFEPGPKQFAALKARTERLASQWQLKPGSIELVNAGLGDVDGRAHGDSGNGQLTSFTISHEADANGVAVDIVSLDHHLNGGPLTFLKADVEGMEMALLRGAQATINRHRPKIAVCAYHYPSDIPELARAIAELGPDYRFALRHHAPQLMETVLYCWRH
jgi:FkbM family methyltransferase